MTLLKPTLASEPRSALVMSFEYVSLKYIIRANDLPDLTPKKDFLVDYVNNTTLTGEAFTIDASEVHTFIFNLISPNE